MNRGKLHEYFLKYPRIGKKVRELFYMITVPSKKEREKIKFEIHLAEHCNLNCKCCNNFSPLDNEEYLNYDIFLRDIQRMKELFGGEAEQITLMGGEPLLNRDICNIICKVRHAFSKCKLVVVTNGILLLNMPIDFWTCCFDNQVEISVSYYPIKLEIEKIKSVAKKNNVEIKFEIENGTITENYTERIPLDLEGKQNKKLNFKMCYKSNNCIQLKDGKLYTCSLIPNIVHFNNYFCENLDITEDDYVDIYKAKSKEEIIKKLNTPPAFCKYCDWANMESGIKWGISKKDKEEWAEL